MSASTERAKQKRSAVVLDLNRLEERTRRVGMGLTAISLSITLGLGIAIIFPARESVVVVWPWAFTGSVMLGGIALLVLLSWLNLSRHLHEIANLRRRTVEQQETELIRIENLYSRLMELNASCLTMTSKSTSTSLFSRVTQICFDTFTCERASLMINDPVEKELIVKAAVGHGDMDLVLGARQPIGDGIAGWVGEHRKPLLLGPEVNPKQFWRFKPKAEPIHSAMAAPIILPDGLRGVLCVSSKSSDVLYSQEDLRAHQVLAWNAALNIRQFELTASGPDGESHRRIA
jgi:hypothetical protein